jgi:FkbH-like protein
LEDKFGDNGLICAIILEKKENKNLFIDTWFMSCRVLKRGMEVYTLNTIAELAKVNGYEQVIGEYIPTSKNEMVCDHYKSLGFEAVTTENLWQLDVTKYEMKSNFITKI